MNSTLRYTIIFIILVLFQVFIFGNIELSVYLNIQIYIYFLLILPFGISRLYLLFLSFLLGITIDLFSGGLLGMHAASCLVIGYLRPYLLHSFSGDESSEHIAPSFGTMGVRKFLIYSLVIVFLHHLVYFLLEIFRAPDMAFFIRWGFSSAFDWVFILLLQFTFSRR